MFLCSPAFAQAPVTYRLSFPEPEHHWMQVDVQFPDVPAGRLHVQMSRSSPGRYTLHDFARNVYDVHIDDGNDRALMVQQPNASEWDVTEHDTTVHVQYKVFGDQIDGTYLSIDATHAHINMPAALMWATEIKDRAVRVTFDVPAGKHWKVATQLHPTADPHIFTAANLQYLIDSPVELSDFALRSFHLGQQNFRIALHHDGTDRDADRYAADVERIAAEEAAVFGELPAYEGGVYTFLADYLPDAVRDGMEHRNSTTLTHSRSLREPDQRLDILTTTAHELFHSWNVERIRPASLEPFDLTRHNPSSELWFAEGFTSYYEALILQRSGLATVTQTAATLGATIEAVVLSPARNHGSVEDMSRMAQFVDFISPPTNDRTNLDNIYLSYYWWGSAIALGLDLSLRERSDGKISLDDYMRALWRDYGRPQSVEGAVPKPYTPDDLRNCLAGVAGDRTFADNFFDRYVQGRDVVDYQPLLERAGLLLRKRNARRAWIGSVQLSFDDGSARVSAPSIERTPVYNAGLDEGDEIVSLDRESVGSQSRVDDIVRRHRPGDVLRATIRRRGTTQELTISAEEDPALELVPTEMTRPLTSSERRTRDAWLGSKR